MSFERLVPSTPEWALYYANHWCRYRFAVEQLRELQPSKVLDCACGVGYGSQYLAQELGAGVLGVDRDVSALAVAREHFDHAAVHWCQDDASTLAATAPLGPFDAIVSFETLEHLPTPERFLAAARGALRSGASLLLSTPNASVTSPDGEVAWEHHELELKATELVAMVEQAGFLRPQLFGQSFTAIGRLRQEVRAEANRLRSNPAMRLGRLLQRLLRGHPEPPAPLPESIDDFEFLPFPSARACEALGPEGPFVLIVHAINP